MLGILAFGSLTYDPGPELEAATASRRPMRTPFRVEFARPGKTRGGVPTLLPVKSGGAPVRAVALVLKASVSEADAASLLWRRETRQEGSGRGYTRPADPRPDQVLVEALVDYEGFAKVFYTDFPESGKLRDPMPRELAKTAIGSVGEARSGEDGISYLIAAKAAGIVTPLMAEYEAEIPRRAGADSLEDALARRSAEVRGRS